MTELVPGGVDPNKPSAARIYDCFLGGSHNFAADRAVAERAIELVPELPAIMRANRAFLRRVVRFAVDSGVRQFVDLGSGIPTEGNVHEVALALDPAARIVYVDLEPTAVLHAREILAPVPQAAAALGDLRDPDAIVADPAVTGLIDLTAPVCVLMVAVLHFVPSGPALDAALHRYRTVLAPGSMLAISHATGSARPGALARVADLYSRTGTPLVLRDEAQVSALFAGWDLVEPGIVYGPLWRPDPDQPTTADPASYITLAGVGVKH